jgi:hypothetical protein
MKCKRGFCAFTILCSISMLGQGTFVYDQQSSTDETPFPGAGQVLQTVTPPFGQSFTPTLSSIGFVRLSLSDGNLGDGLGASLYLNLRADSITGTVLASTPTVAMANGFAGTVSFFFPTPVSLTAGVPYFFEPKIETGGPWRAVVGEFSYPGGTAFAGGSSTGGDFWFREGILIPEPSSGALILIGAGFWFFARGQIKNRMNFLRNQKST